MSPEYKATTLYSYSNLSEFPVVCIVYSGYDIDGNVDDENVSLSMLAVLIGWGCIFMFMIVSAVHKYSLTEPIYAAST
jgi:hypothetical protein